MKQEILSAGRKQKNLESVVILLPVLQKRHIRLNLALKALLANAYDTTLQHNTLSYQLGKELGLTDSPDCTPVDVYYDGEYMGNYLLTELPELSNTSVAIEENGSYFMQIDYSHYMERDNNLELSNGMYVTVEEPEKCSDEQIEYLKQLWEETIEALENGGTNPSTKKTVEDYLDLDTYARYYLVQQFAKNPDGFSSSTYCYVPSDEDKIYFCGLWDFDLCYGCDKQLLKLTSPIGYYPDNAGSDFSTVPVVSQKIKDVYENELKDIIEDILLKDGNICKIPGSIQRGNLCFPADELQNMGL